MITGIGPRDHVNFLPKAENPGGRAKEGDLQLQKCLFESREG